MEDVTTSLSDAVRHLRKPFTAAAIRIKPQTVTKNEPRKGLVTFYIDARLVVERLNHVVGAGAWTDEFRLLSDDPKTGLPCECRLTVLGVTKCDVGQIEPGAFDNKAFKSSYSDALKRAAVKFGVGAYLYNLPQVWAPVTVGANGKVRGFSDDGRRQALGEYAAWLSGKNNIYGEPLDHGDVLERVGDDEAHDEAPDTLGTPELLNFAPRGETMWAQVAEMQKHVEPTLDWKAASADLMQQRFGADDRSALTPEEWRDFSTRWVNTVATLSGEMNGDFPPQTGERIQTEFAKWFGGIMPLLTFEKADAPAGVDKAAVGE